MNRRSESQRRRHESPIRSLADTILLKTSRMRAVEVQPITRVARVEAGATWGEVTAAVAAHGLAALAGVVSSPLAGVQPAMGTEILTAAFVVVVIGGLGSFWGVIAAGIALSALPEVLRFSADFRMIIYGVILVVAMLVVPPATAFLLTDRLSRMLLLAVGFGLTSAVAGYWLARWWDCSIAGAMAMVAGGLFLLALLLSPRYGLLGRLLTHRRLRERLAGQLVLLHLQEGERELAVPRLQQRFGWSPARVRRVLRRLVRAGWVEEQGAGLRLTAAGTEHLAAFGGSRLGRRG